MFTRPKLGIFVGEEDWKFFNEIFVDLTDHFQCDVFQQKTYSTPLLYGRLNRWAYQSGIRRSLKSNDICFFEWASEHLMVASHMPKLCTIVTRLHSFELYDWAPKINWDNVDKVILVSKTMQELFNEAYPEHSQKTMVVHNGRSVEKFKGPQKKSFNFRIGMLCSIIPIKRIYEVVVMISDLRKRGLDVYLQVAGSPKDDHRYVIAINRLVKKLELQDYVIFTGHVANSHIWLKDIDIFISNSYWEGQQVALIEAMASECYCLSHAWAGAEEMLPEENLYITESELQRKIISYSELSEEEKVRCCAYMRDIAVSKFDIEKTKVQIRQVISEMSEHTTLESSFQIG